MKALSIQQPWAYCITHGTKRVENRTWNAWYRGLLLIHAAKKFQTGVEYEIHLDSPEVDLRGMKAAPRGAIVGVCRMIDSVRPDKVSTEQRVWAGGPYCFILDEVRAFSEPIPYKGELGLFEVPNHVVAQALWALGLAA